MVISLKEKQLHAFCFYARLTLLLAVFLLQEDLRLAYLLIWGFVGFSFKSTFERFLSTLMHAYLLFRVVSRIAVSLFPWGICACTLYPHFIPKKSRSFLKIGSHIIHLLFELLEAVVQFYPAFVCLCSRQILSIEYRYGSEQSLCYSS